MYTNSITAILIVRCLGLETSAAWAKAPIMNTLNPPE